MDITKEESVRFSGSKVGSLPVYKAAFHGACNVP